MLEEILFRDADYLWSLNPNGRPWERVVAPWIFSWARALKASCNVNEFIGFMTAEPLNPLLVETTIAA